MSNTEKWLFLIFGVVIFSLIIGKTMEKNINIPRKYEKPKMVIPTMAPATKQLVKVTRVIDGDTIEIEGGEKVRYIGMDAPETVDPRKPVQCFGKEASAENKQLVEGKEVELEKDVSETDKYGRLLRYVWLNGAMIDQELVQLGFARIETIPPDVKYEDIFKTAENSARTKNIGLWSKCQ